MPSRYSSESTRADARGGERESRRRLPRAADRDSLWVALDGALGGLEGLAAENLQARIRGTMLMALSILLRVARARDRQQVGDGGRLLDALRRHGRGLRAPQGRLQDGRVPPRKSSEGAGRARAVPASTIERPPTAELRAEQRDDQSLPPYERSTRCSRRTSSSTGRARSSSSCSPAVVEKTLALVDRRSTSADRRLRA